MKKGEKLQVQREKDELKINRFNLQSGFENTAIKYKNKTVWGIDDRIQRLQKSIIIAY